MTRIPLADLFRCAVDVLEAEKIPYFVYGGMALPAWGQVVTTEDVDVVVRVGGDKVPRLMAALRRAGLSIPAATRSTTTGTRRPTCASRWIAQRNTAKKRYDAMIPQFQLVIQFPEWHMDFDSLIQLEMSLVAKLGEEVDGHDLGSGEANIFILTSQPEQAFCVVRNVLSNEQLINAKVAYRPLMGDEYTILWPPDLREFAVK